MRAPPARAIDASIGVGEGLPCGQATRIIDPCTGTPPSRLGLRTRPLRESVAGGTAHEHT